MEENKTIRRSLEEITASARMNMQDMINRAIGLGQDCIDAKEQLGHGKFLPWLRELGLSSSTASNYMRVAREIAPGSRLASVGYSKALALLNAPAEEREALAEETEGQSAAEIRKLIEERNRAAEAANAETARANRAEAQAKEYYDTIAHRNTRIRVLEDANDQLRAELLTAENNRVEVEKVVEKVPEDYERIKKQLANAQRSADDLIEAAAAAEERAAAAEAELERISQGSASTAEPVWKILHMALTRFEMDVLPILNTPPGELSKGSEKIRRDLEMIRQWVKTFDDMLQRNLQSDGAVIIE